MAHPHVVVQEDVLNFSRITSVVVCALTSDLHKANEPGNVPLDVGEGALSQQSVVVVSQIVAVAKTPTVEREAPRGTLRVQPARPSAPCAAFEGRSEPGSGRMRARQHPSLRPFFSLTPGARVGRDQQALESGRVLLALHCCTELAADGGDRSGKDRDRLGPDAKEIKIKCVRTCRSVRSTAAIRRTAAGRFRTSRMAGQLSTAQPRA